MHTCSLILQTKRGLTLLLVALAVSACPARAQSVASAHGPSQSLWVGGEFSNTAAGFPHDSSVRLSGIGAWSSYNWTHHIGVEANMRWMNFSSWHGETEQSYLIGPRYTFMNSRKWRPFAALGVGVTSIHYPFSMGDGTSFTLAPRGGVELRMKRKWLLRASYEADLLTNSPDFTNEPKFGIHPNGAQIGIGYRIF